MMFSHATGYKNVYVCISIHSLAISDYISHIWQVVGWFWQHLQLVISKVSSCLAILRPCETPDASQHTSAPRYGCNFTRLCVKGETQFTTNANIDLKLPEQDTVVQLAIKRLVYWRLGQRGCHPALRPSKICVLCTSGMQNLSLELQVVQTLITIRGFGEVGKLAWPQGTVISTPRKPMGCIC